jgi:AcrR family transcriptional regulator
LTRRRKHRVRDPDATRRKILEAVGIILTEQGFASVKTNKIARLLGKDKNLIRYHFGSLNGLLKTYITEKDYWKPFFERFRFSENPDEKEIRDLFVGLMQENFKLFSESIEMQKIIHWQISENSALMKSISDEREIEGEKLLRMATPYFRETGISFKAILALILGGSYYMVLQHTAINGVVSGVDLNNDKDRSEVLYAIECIIDWAFSYARENKDNQIKSTNTMQYELELLESLSDELLNNPTDKALFDKLEIELKRLERVLLKKLLELSNEMQIRNFLQVNLYRMGEICDIHFDSSAKENKVAQAILDLMDHLTSQVEPMLPDTLTLPKLFCFQQSIDYMNKWKMLEKKLIEVGIDEDFLEIMKIPFERFNHFSQMLGCWKN